MITFNWSHNVNNTDYWFVYAVVYHLGIPLSSNKDVIPTQLMLRFAKT